MKKSNLLIIFLCCLFIYTNVSAQQDTEFEFEFELVSDDDDDDGDDGNYGGGDDDENDDDDDDDDDENDKSNNKSNSPLRAEVTLTNVGVSLLTEDITFRAHVGTTVPDGLPSEYDTESTVTFETPLLTGDTKSFSMLMPTSSLQFGVDNIVTIWPLASSAKNLKGKPPHYTYQLIFIPKTTFDNQLTGLNNVIVSKVNIYPNPTNGILQIEIPDNENSSNQITIYNTAGQPIKTFKRASGLTTLDLQQLMSGIYFVAIRNESGQIIHYSKLIFHR